MTRRLVGLAIALLGVAASVPAHAGYVQSGYATCVEYADASGVCYGTMDGARNSADPNFGVEFQISTSPQGAVKPHTTFIATFTASNGVSKRRVCDASDVPYLSGHGTSSLLGAYGYFYFGWNSAGQCGGVYVGMGSAY